MFMMCFVAVCFQDRVCCGENADQLVYLPPLQVSEGNSLVFCDYASCSPSIHPSIGLTIHSVEVCRGAWSPSQLTRGKRHTGHKSYTGLAQRHKQPFTLISTPAATLESPVSLACQKGKALQQYATKSWAEKKGERKTDRTKHKNCGAEAWCSVHQVPQQPEPCAA